MTKGMSVMMAGGLLTLAGLLGSAGAANASVASTAPLGAHAAVSARAVPHSPDGIYDSRLCGNSYFQVNDGTYVHEFFPAGATYINGGTQHAWEEQVWWEGIFEVSGYHFVVDCY